jgi:hypothetical protein
MITAFEVDRARWGQGALLRKDDKMCCLGFLSVACGVPTTALGSRSFPDSRWVAEYGVPRVFTGFTSYSSVDMSPTYRAAATNDSDNLSLAEKEAVLIKLFAEHNIILTFTGEHP